MEEAIEQIKQKNYIDCLKNYRGEVLLVGVNYDKDKHHTCKIKKIKNNDIFKYTNEKASQFYKFLFKYTKY